MAFNPIKIFPIDQKPGIGVGINLPFNAPSVFYSNYTTQDSIKNNLINFLLTNNNERYFNPNFGGNLRAFIFQQIEENNIDYLKEDLQSKINIYFPNIIIIELNISSIPDLNQISMELKYKIKDTGLTNNIQLLFT